MIALMAALAVASVRPDPMSIEIVGGSSPRMISIGDKVQLTVRVRNRGSSPAQVFKPIYGLSIYGERKPKLSSSTTARATNYTAQMVESIRPKSYRDYPIEVAVDKSNFGTKPERFRLELTYFSEVAAKVGRQLKWPHVPWSANAALGELHVYPRKEQYQVWIEKPVREPGILLEVGKDPSEKDLLGRYSFATGFGGEVLTLEPNGAASASFSTDLLTRDNPDGHSTAKAKWAMKDGMVVVTYSSSDYNATRQYIPVLWDGNHVLIPSDHRQFFFEEVWKRQQDCWAKKANVWFMHGYFLSQGYPSSYFGPIEVPSRFMAEFERLVGRRARR